MSEKRIRMMTKLADFEQRNRKLLQNAGEYYRGDFIGIRLLKNLFRITAAYLLGAALWAVYNEEAIMKKLNTMDIQGLAAGLLIAYGIVLILFLTLTYVISAVEHYKAEKKQQTYRNMLERLVLEYDHETSDRAGRGMKKRNGKQGGTYHGNIVGL